MTKSQKNSITTMRCIIAVCLLAILPLPLPSAPASGSQAASYDRRMSPIGISGIDARWRHFGPYLQKFIDTIQTKWDALYEKIEVTEPAGTKVTVKFRINSKGKITEIISTGGNGGPQAIQICKDAIIQPAPYDNWTNDMVAMLGDTQEMVFTFSFGKPRT